MSYNLFIEQNGVIILKKKFSLLAFIIFVLAASFFGSLYKNMPHGLKVNLPVDESYALSVYYIDVGQADCAIITLPDEKVMMIDAGNNDDSELILACLKSLDIENIDYLVGTHPHEDHIGSLDTVINNLSVSEVFMPDCEADTQTYRDVVSAIENNSLTVTYASAGTVIYEDDNLKIKAVAPTKEYDDLNNMSIVIHLTYKDSTFLFTGDAEEESEYDITLPVEADVLKVCHHGSTTSSSQSFLTRVDPMYAVISCGLNND